jgi:hypothetical protein
VDSIILILLVLAAVKTLVFGGLLGWVFRDDIREWRSGRKKAPMVTPVCIYCESKWTQAVDEGQSHWENDELVLVTTYECQHCHLPFWHVERVQMTGIKT